jgi:hypothetical protein
MLRGNHYERAFEGWLQSQRLCHVVVDETRRSLLCDGPIKSLDFIVLGPSGARLVVDIKGKRFPSGTAGKQRKVWKNWANREDVESLARWVPLLGPGYEGIFVFAYHLQPGFELLENTRDLFIWHDRQYLLRAVEVEAYRRHMYTISPRWDTVALPAAAFRKLLRPVSHFTHGLPVVPHACPF